MKKLVLSLSLSVASLFAVDAGVVSPSAVNNDITPPTSITNSNPNGVNITPPSIINNNPNLRVDPIITLTAIGEGVTPLNTISPAQARVLARRAAIADAYRAMSEKMYGIKITAKDRVKNLVAVNSEIRTAVYGVIKGAQIEDVNFQDGLYRVSMEVKINMCDWQAKINCRTNRCIYKCN